MPIIPSATLRVKRVLSPTKYPADRFLGKWVYLNNYDGWDSRYGYDSIRMIFSVDVQGSDYEISTYHILYLTKEENVTLLFCFFLFL